MWDQVREDCYHILFLILNRGELDLGLLGFDENSKSLLDTEKV